MNLKMSEFSGDWTRIHIHRLFKGSITFERVLHQIINRQEPEYTSIVLLNAVCA